MSLRNIQNNLFQGNGWHSSLHRPRYRSTRRCSTHQVYRLLVCRFGRRTACCASIKRPYLCEHHVEWTWTYSCKLSNSNHSFWFKDGKFHHVLVVQTNRKLEVILDKCSELTSANCYQVVIADDDERLNVASPLQLGGYKKPSQAGDRHLHPLLRGKKSFDGCIRNLVVNGDVSLFRLWSTITIFRPMILNHPKWLPALNMVAKIYGGDSVRPKIIHVITENAILLPKIVMLANVDRDLLDLTASKKPSGLNSSILRAT